MSGGAFPQLAVVGEVGAEAGSEVSVKAIHEGLAEADWENVLIHKGAGGSKNLGAIIL
jgi:hypothetical protein